MGHGLEKGVRKQTYLRNKVCFTALELVVPPYLINGYPKSGGTWAG